MQAAGHSQADEKKGYWAAVIPLHDQQNDEQ
jgi:hypothetical protein